VGAGLFYVNIVCSRQKIEDVLRLFLKKELMQLDASSEEQSLKER